MLSFDRLQLIDSGYMVAVGAAALAGGIAATSSLIGSYINMRNQADTNKTNRDIANESLEKQEQWRKEDMAYQDAVREATWAREDQLLQAQQAREDTSYQRSVADAMAAGLSPLAVAQLDGSAGSVITSQGATSAPNVGQPASWTAQAPQMDISSLISSVLSTSNLSELARHNKATEANASRELDLKSTELTTQAEQFKQMYDFNVEKFGKEYALEEKKFNQSVIQFTSTISMQKTFHADEMSEKEKAREWDSIMKNQDIRTEQYQEFCRVADCPVKLYPVYNLDDYYKGVENAKNSLYNGNRKFLNRASGLDDNDIFSPEEYDDSYSENAGQSNSVSANGVPAEPFTSRVSASASRSTNGGFSKNQSTKVRELRQQCYGQADISYPVLVESYAQWESDWKRRNKK